MTNDRKVVIGQVSVDSGLLVIHDPCYAKGQESLEMGKIIERLTDMPCPNHAQLRFNAGHEGAGVVFSSGLGDGMYNVVATIGEVEGWGERIKKVEIILVEDD